MSNAYPKAYVCKDCGSEHAIEGVWIITDFYRYRIHYASPTSIGPATELKVIEAESLTDARDYAKKRAAELGGRVAEVYKLEEVV